MKFRVAEAVTETGGVVTGSVLLKLKNALGITIAIFWVLPKI